jgi:hypothetical protein
VLLEPDAFDRLRSAATAATAAAAITFSPTGATLRVDGPVLSGRIETEFEMTTDDAAKGTVAL